MNSPTDRSDLSRRDPLDQRWIADFLAVHGRMPTDEDRQDHLFSLMFLGSGLGGTWIDRDWAGYKLRKVALWSGEEAWQAEDVTPGFDRFQLHLERLSGFYGYDRAGAARFARAVGLAWGGIAYEDSALLALISAAAGDHLPQIHEGAAQWKSEYVDDANPAHHWAASFLAGFYYGEFVGIVTNSAREIAQYVAGMGGTKGDIRLGNIAADQGDNLRRSSTGGVAPESSPYSAFIDEMRQQLRVRD